MEPFFANRVYDLHVALVPGSHSKGDRRQPMDPCVMAVTDSDVMSLADVERVYM